jgi:hypothetical protein
MRIESNQSIDSMGVGSEPRCGSHSQASSWILVGLAVQGKNTICDGHGSDGE